MRRSLLLGLAAISVGLLSACGNADTAAPGPVAPTTATATTTTESVAPPVEKPVMPPLPEVAEANETIVKTTTPPPPPPPAPEGIPCDAGVDACVDLSANQSWLLKDGAVVMGPVPITHGRAGHRTPPGTFKVSFKNKDHVSSIYDAPMPYSVFFNGGIAFHQGSLSELSHGCIHLAKSAAKTFFNGLAVGDTVQVVQ
jgi:hypothetical protein